MRRSMLLLGALLCLVLAAPNLAEAGIVARINISSRKARLPHANRHIQGDRHLPLSCLDDL